MGADFTSFLSENDNFLEKAFAEASKLAPVDQDALAERILADLRDEEPWDRSFEKTTDDQWNRMADIVP